MAFPRSIQPGFKYEEAVTLLTLAQQTYDQTPDNPPSNIVVPCQMKVPKPPTNWVVDPDLTPTTTTLLDNFWQVSRNKDCPNQYVIAIRGTTDTDSSIVADLLFPLVRARIDLKGLPFGLNLARQEDGSKVVAGVHSGFLLGLVLMLLTTDRPLMATLTKLAVVPGTEVYITGHSQGASLALLLTSLVRHSERAFKGPAYKTYAFAPAKPGNDHYAYDLDRIASVKGLCYSVVNTQGWVPQAPLTIETLGTLNTPNPVFKFSGQVNPSLSAEVRKLVKDVDQFFETIWEDVLAALKKVIDFLERELSRAAFTLRASDLGCEGDDTPMDSSVVSGFLDDLLDLVLPNLNYTAAGALAPVFGTPGGNPDDKKFNQFDFFWQHHLCNYLLYLTEQYKPKDKKSDDC